MKHGRLAVLTLSMVALVAARPPARYQPDPSSVIAATIALNRLAQEKGQWTAYRDMAADDAILFAPQKLLAKDWLKKQANPPAAVTSSPTTIYVSCEGRLAASTGHWTRADGSAGHFTTIWQRDKKGRWQWLMDHRDTRPMPRESEDAVTGKVATCKRAAPPAPAAHNVPADPRSKKGRPDGKLPPPPDESLIWSAEVAPDNSRRVTVRMWTGEAYEMVIDDKVGAPT